MLYGCMDGLDLSQNITPPRAPCGANKYQRQIFEKWEQNPKNLFGVFAQVKIGLKKFLLQKEKNN